MIFETDNIKEFLRKALQWASGFGSVCYLYSNNFNDPYSKFDTLIAAGTADELTCTAGTAFDELARFREKHPGWLTGFLGYDLKNETERLTSGNPDHLHFPDLYFFVPQHVILIKANQVEIKADNPQAIFETICSQAIAPFAPQQALHIQSRFSKAEYLSVIADIKKHISRGEIYVTNFCQEFYAVDAVIDPLSVFLKLNEASPNPFSTFFKWKNNYLLCASPERFLAKRGDRLISQPIKGTARRGKNELEDEAIKLELRNQTKEQQENVMIVDLVRNDLSRSAKQGSVKVEELFGIYSFKQVHQMISTVVCELDADVSTIQAIKNAFPMGSMTGAPKLSAMQLMEKYERSKRGVYSGAVGYFSPNDDCDLNVVIRSLLYNQQNKYLSFHAGSAITYHADAESEYEECLLKVKAIRDVLGG